MEKRLQRVDDMMKNVFGSTVKLLDYYGPVQMCCFGLTYNYFEESGYFHYEDVESDLRDLATAIKRIVEMER